LKVEPINAKSFMEFFEKEAGIVFIDSATGNKALDMIEAEASSGKLCGDCGYASRGDGVSTHAEDIVCVNADSPSTCDFVFANNCGCNYWAEQNAKDGNGE
jgi:hypothetical protein